MMVMKKEMSYKIIEESRLIIEFFSGDINIDDIIHLQNIISDELNYNPTFDLVFDTREANILVNEKDMIKYLEFVKNHPKIYGKRKAAYLTSKPNEVVVGTLFSKLINDVPIHANVFSTTEAIVNWLKNKNIDNQLLTSVINTLKKQSSNPQ